MMKLFIYGFREDERLYFENSKAQYQFTYDVCYEKATLTNAHLAAGYDCISILSTPFPKALIEAFVHLGITYISTRTVGYDHIDIEAAKALGMHVGNVTYAPEGVAEYTMMLMLMALRKMKLILASMAVQDYSFDGVRGSNLNEKTIGIIGCGNIAQALIRLLSGFNCRILVYSRTEKAAMKPYATFCRFAQIVNESDVISLHLPLSQETHHLINRDAFQKMKQGVTIINTSRGALIDSMALIEAIENGKVGAAALDVVEQETGVYYHDCKARILKQREIALLNSYPNVIMTPHLAWLSEESISEMVLHSIQSCYHYMHGEPNPWQIC